MKHTNLNESNIHRVNIAEVGNRWQVKGDRLYLSDDFKLKALGLEVQYYKTGNICGATQNGETISNTKATKLIDGCRRAWVDLETGELRDCTRSEAEDLLVEAINALVVEEYFINCIPEDAEKVFETERIKVFRTNGAFLMRFIDKYHVSHDRPVYIFGIDTCTDATVREHDWDFIVPKSFDGKIHIYSPRDMFRVTSCDYWTDQDENQDPDLKAQVEKVREFLMDFYADVLDAAEARGKAEGKDRVEYWQEEQKKHFREGVYEADGCLIHVNFVTHFRGSVEVDYDNYATAYANFSCKAKVEVVDGVDQIVERGHIIRATDRLSDEEVARRLAEGN